MTKNALFSTDEVIDALGGTSAVGRLLSRRPQAVHNWRGRMRGKFPPETFLILMEELRRNGYSAPSALWGLQPPRRRTA